MTLVEQGAANEPMADQDVAALRLTRVAKRYGAVTAVKDISFAARAGEVHALLGENGAGKSTLMGIASGVVRADAGAVEICGTTIERLTPAQAQSLGLAIVHQHPAVLPELTVAENMLLAIPLNLRQGGGSGVEWVANQLRRVGSTVHPRTRMSEVDIAQRQLYELAKALAIEPKVLILDEPTAALTADLVEDLFKKIRAAAARGAAVIYISHRLQEIRQIADRITVMRDGEIKGVSRVDEISDDEILRLIVGRNFDHTYPPKGAGPKPDAPGLQVAGLTGANFYDVSMTARGGEIIGIAGITGNGQSEFLRALAGLAPASGTVSLAGKPIGLGRPDGARRAGVNYLSSDRQKEGLFMSLSVRENAALAALPLFSRFGFVRQRVEYGAIEEQRVELAIKTANIDSNIGALSGGNQQKVILARALVARSALVLAEEPTAGVDVGARAEIYRILRDASNAGTPVVIVSSDVHELEGLCDRVLVFSRGHVVGELTGDRVTETEIGRVMVTATAHRRGRDRTGAGAAGWRSRLKSFGAGDYVSSVVLAILVFAIAAYVSTNNIRFISSFNVQKILLLCSALAFVGFGQMCAVLTGGIDLSVGPLVGLCVVIASFFFGDIGALPSMALGGLAMVSVCAFVGLVNGSLVRFANFTSVAATLGVYVMIQGVSVLLRPFPAGSIDSDVIALIQTNLFGIPAPFVIVVVLAALLELALHRTRWGLSIRAVGSNEISAAKIGIRTSWVVLGAFLASSLLTAIGGVMVMAQLGIGDPNQGVEYTLGSVAAVVLGGASLFGGRGSFLGVLFGALLIQEVNSATTFLGLSQAWQVLVRRVVDALRGGGLFPGPTFFG